MARRQLSSIMFTDLVGYTSMMQEDEDNAKKVRDSHREILESEISKNQGHILQYYGDGALSIFESNVSAVRSAISIQNRSSEKEIPLRIGIHSGDVVIEEDGVFGDGVNVASRIESLSIAGGVVISEKVYDDLKNHLEFNPKLLGQFELKNVRKPMEVYALTNQGLAVPERKDLKGKVKDKIDAIAINEFDNLSPNPDNELICKGIREELLSLFSKSPGLKVFSKDGISDEFDRSNLQKLYAEFGVKAVIKGSLRRSKQRAKVNVDLISSSDSFLLWNKAYSMEIIDELEFEEKVSLAIYEDLKEKNLIGYIEKEKSAPAVNLQARELYLQGLYFYNKWTPSYAKKSIGSFEKAIEIDPEYDQAYSGLALSYILLSASGYMAPSNGAELSYAAAKRALEINKENEEAYAAMAVNDILLRFDFESGDFNSKKAVELNPNSAQANLCRSLYYLVAEQLEDSLDSMTKAKEFDPLSTIINRTLADLHYFKGNYKLAIEIYDWILQLDPEFASAKEFKAWAYLMNGDMDTAIEMFSSYDGEAIYGIRPFVQLGYAYSMKGDRKKALFYLDQLKEKAKNEPEGFHDLDFATLYCGLGMADEAFRHMNKCIDFKIGPMVFIHVSPIWNPIKSDPRFQECIKKVGLNR